MSRRNNLRGLTSCGAVSAHDSHVRALVGPRFWRKKNPMLKTHMPGPWQVHITRYPNGQLSGTPYIYAPNGPDMHRHVAEVCIDDDAEAATTSMQEANARLIAAAPELLALVLRLDAICKRGGDIQRGPKGLEFDLQSQINAAIAKVSGGMTR